MIINVTEIFHRKDLRTMMGLNQVGQQGMWRAFLPLPRVRIVKWKEGMKALWPHVDIILGEVIVLI